MILNWQFWFAATRMSLVAALEREPQTRVASTAYDVRSVHCPGPRRGTSSLGEARDRWPLVAPALTGTLTTTLVVVELEERTTGALVVVSGGALVVVVLGWTTGAVVVDRGGGSATVVDVDVVLVLDVVLV